MRRAIGELARTAGEARTLVHWFSGAVDEEPIRGDKKAIGVERFETDEDAVIPDVWFEIQKRNTRHDR